MRDLIIIGGGVAGLSAAITAASEGLETLVISGESPPVIRESPLIENVPGFTGSGREFHEKLWQQAIAFGIRYVPTDAIALIPERTPDGPMWTVDTEDSVPPGYSAKDILVATGMKRTMIPNLSPPADGAKSVAVLGGGNAAGQAALQYAKEGLWVDLFAKRPITQTMSAYLVNRVRGEANIEVHEASVVIGCEQDGDGLCVKLEDGLEHKTDGAKCCLGGAPNTDLLKDLVLLTDDGYVYIYFHHQHLAVRQYAEGVEHSSFEHPIYVAGDIRGPVSLPKRAGFAIGDGVAAVHDIIKARSKENERKPVATDD